MGHLEEVAHCSFSKHAGKPALDWPSRRLGTDDASLSGASLRHFPNSNTVFILCYKAVGFSWWGPSFLCP